MSTLEEMGISGKPSKMYWKMTDEEKKEFVSARVYPVTKQTPEKVNYIDKLPILTQVRLKREVK